MVGRKEEQRRVIGTVTRARRLAARKREIGKDQEIKRRVIGVAGLQQKQQQEQQQGQ
jgi:hypothetical protein